MSLTKQNLVTKSAMELLNRSQSSFAAEKKKEALDIFNSIPIPKEKDEDWRYTQIGKFRIPKLNQKTKITARKLSDDLTEKGVVLTDINTALDKYEIARNHYFKNISFGNDKYNALVASHFEHGIFLHVPKNVEIDAPLTANFEVENDGILHNIIIAEPNSKFDFIEEYSSKESSSENINACVTEVFANSSNLNFYHINSWPKNISNFTNITGTLGRNSNLNWVSACFGGKINRIKINTVFEGQGAQCSNIGIFLGKGKEHIDFNTNMYHNAENTINDVLIDGILRDESSSVYRGLIQIPKTGQKTNSYLANHILKLGDKTLANSIPSLKIDANDVKASHGATVGQIDEEHLFYLMARGLSRDEAERLIIEGFFEPVIQKIPNEELREKIRELIKN